MPILIGKMYLPYTFTLFCTATRIRGRERKSPRSTSQEYKIWKREEFYWERSGESKDRYRNTQERTGGQGSNPKHVVDNYVMINKRPYQ